MPKYTIFLLFFFLCFYSKGQVSLTDIDHLVSLTDYDHLYSNFEAKRNAAKAIKLKSIAVATLDKKKSKIWNFGVHESYDTNGNIQSSENHPYANYRYGDDIYFTYDSLNRMETITQYTLYLSRMIYLKLHYENGRVGYIVSNSGRTEELTYDTFYYTYYSDGKIKSRIEKRYGKEYHAYWPLVTKYYHYNKFDDVYIDNQERDTFVELNIRDQNNCVIETKEMHGLTGTRMLCDGACNVLEYSEFSSINNHPIAINKIESVYNYNNRLKEEKFFYCPRKVLTSCKGKLKFNRSVQYEYYDIGLVQNEITRNKRGKITMIKKYNYEFYSN